MLILRCGVIGAPIFEELINRGGEKINPLEVDSTFLQHSAVAEAVAFGAPDEKYGQEVNAAIVLRKHNNKDHLDQTKVIADLHEHCQGMLVGFKCPKRIFIVDKLPLTATGKIQRSNVAKHVQKASGLVKSKL